MRTHPKFTRTRDMLTAPEVPRTDAGGIALCHWHQREIYFAGGFLKLLVRDLERIARYVRHHRLNALTSDQHSEGEKL